MPSAISKGDNAFLAALKADAALDNRLDTLRNTRKLATRLAVFNCIMFFTLFSLEIYFSSKGVNPRPITVMILAGAVIPAIFATIAHGEIRTLLMFRHLSERPIASNE